LRVTLGRWRRRLLQSEVHAGGQMRPVRDEFVSSVALREDAALKGPRYERAHDQSGKQQCRQCTSHVILPKESQNRKVKREK
jgi:hypothetical protein